MGQAHEERLIRGFYPLQKDLRWTKPAFALALDPPRTERPIYLELQFFLPGELMDQARSITLIASVNGVEVGRQTYYGTGHCVFTRYVPHRALAQRAEVEVEMDRAATHPDDRRLHISPEKELELRKLYTALPLWDNVRFQNVPLNKNPLDLWMTQQIVF
jgi:hypothetical protein